MTDRTPAVDGIDPVTFQIIKHRLNRVTDEAVKALKRVSGSPITNEAHDLMVSLYNREGDLMTGGIGYLHHYVGASRAVKHILETFGDDLFEGDMFLLNDPYTAALHPPDAYIINPIFSEGNLEAFSASFVHVTDIGAIDAGGFSPSSTSTYHEGFQTPGLKLIHRGEMRDDVLDTILNMTRDPGMVELDIRSQISAHNVATDRMLDLFEEYGPDAVESTSEQLIEQSEAKCRNRLSELPDGEWQERQYLDSTPEDKVFTIDLTLRKEGNSLTFDFAGTSEASSYGFNCAFHSTVGGITAPLFPLICHDVTWNEGVLAPIEVNAPEGTLVNADRPSPISVATVSTIQICNHLATLTLSKLLGSSEAFADRATGVWAGAHGPVQLEVTYENGETMLDMLTDPLAGAGGATALADGIDLGGEVTNLVSRWGNVERHEKILPVRYLFRRMAQDSGGPGRFRGGAGPEYAVTPVMGDGIADIRIITCGRGTRVPLGMGIAGGHPSITSEYSIVRGPTDWDGPDDGQAAGEPWGDSDRVDATWGEHAFGNGDVFYHRVTGGGGFGDPVEREPERVIHDVKTGRVSAESAHSEYGVPVDDRGDLVDSIEDRRREIIDERRSDTASCAPPIQFADTEETSLKLGAKLDVRREIGTQERYSTCGNCRTVLCRVAENWKEQVPVSKDPVSAAGPNREAQDGFELRRFVCPDCGTLLDTEIALEEQPYLVSRLE